MTSREKRRIARVRKYYRDSGSGEWRRLVKDPYHRLEFDTTLHFLEQYLPLQGEILDAGSGPGRYSIELARRGYRVTLLDLVPENLERARRNARRAGVGERMVGTVEGSITDLSRFEDRSFAGVLCLGGTLNHVLSTSGRDRAVRELARVTRPGGPLFVSVISRYAALVDGVIRHPDGLRTDAEHHWRILRSGDYDGHRGFAPCHFIVPAELTTLLGRQRLRVVELAGLEGLVTAHDRSVNRLARVDPEAWESWKKFHLATCTDPAVVATSEHFLAVAMRR